MLSWRRHCGEVHRPRGERSHSPHAQPQLLPHHGLLRGSGLPAPVQIPEHIGEANRGYRLVVRTDDRIQSPHQYSVVEAIDTPLAEMLTQSGRGYRAAREYVTSGSQHALPVGIDEI